MAGVWLRVTVQNREIGDALWTIVARKEFSFSFSSQIHFIGFLKYPRQVFIQKLRVD